MAKHAPTVMAEASLHLHKAHNDQRAWKAKMESAEELAKAELLAEGLPLTVRNIVTRQWAIAGRF